MENDKDKAPDTNELSGLLGALLSNPSSLSKIRDIIAAHVDSENGTSPPPIEEISVQNSNIDTLSGENLPENEGVSPTFKSEGGFDISNLLPLISSLGASDDAKKISQKNKQTALLCAIKPYLSERRRTLIDSYIKFTQLSGIFKDLA